MTGLKKLLVSVSVFVLTLCLWTVSTYAEEASGNTGTITGSVVNLREEPSTSAKVLDKLPKGTEVNVLSSSDVWYKVSYDGKTGWVHGDYLHVVEKTIGIGTVTVDVLNVRSKPDVTSDVLSQIHKGTKVAVLTQSGDWYKIKTTDGTAAWVASEYLTLDTSAASRGGDAERDVKILDVSTSTGQKIVEYAKKFMGVKYVYGGTSPNGFDCSGFVQYVFKHFGIKLNRTAADQAKHGTKVSKSELEIGDLVFFGSSSYINHVGIYIGNGKFIHAESERSGVTITNLSESYYTRSYVTARRIL